MIGAIAGDIIGSAYEGASTKREDFPLFSLRSRFTDDTVLTLAVAEAILTGESYTKAVRRIGRQYPNAGYGGYFRMWLFSDDHRPYNSWGNGSAMRVSPVGFAFDDEATVLTEAEKSAAITHDHPEGIKGAQAVALAVFLARSGRSKADIAEAITGRFGYDLSRTLDDIRPHYGFDVSCAGSVPQAIIAFLESTDVESAIRKAVSLGGDSDTQACMAGGIAQPFYGYPPKEIVDAVRSRLPEALLDILDRFEARFP